MKKDKEQRPQVGIGVMIFKDGKVLLGKRKGSHGSNRYAFPGGHLEYMESFEDCAKRETLEECGININKIKFQLLANMKEYSPKHYIHINLMADWKSGEAKVLEPDKCENWDWYNLNKLPRPLFRACEWAIENYKTGKNYFDN